MLDIAAIVTRSASARNVDMSLEKSESEKPLEDLQHQTVTFRPKIKKFLELSRGFLLGVWSGGGLSGVSKKTCFRLFTFSVQQAVR